MGRPRKSNLERRVSRVELRLTIAEQIALEQQAMMAGVTVADFVRRAALGYQLPPDRAEQRTEALLATALIKLGSNLNQINRQLGETGQMPHELPGLIARIHTQLDQFYGSAPHQDGP